MRHAAIVLAGLLCSATFAREPDHLPPFDAASKQFQYEEVVQEPGTVAELYSRAKAWVATAYKSPRNVIQLDDPNGGRLVIKGRFTVASFAVDSVSHTWTIEVKDNRYRYVLSNFVASISFGDARSEALIGNGHKKGRALLGQIAQLAEPMIEGLKTAMKNPTPAAADW